MKKTKFNFKYLAISLSSTAILSASAISLYTLLNQNYNNNLNYVNQNLKTTITTPNNVVGKKVGAIRHWQNNNFSGVELKNGGFAVLTEENSATRIDAFGNILWEFKPEELKTYYPDFQDKKVVEIAQDEGNNSNIIYLLLVPNKVIDSKQEIDQPDPYFYEDIIKSTSTNSNKAIVVQISDNSNVYLNNKWNPSFTILNHININPQKMVDNYPEQWKSKSSTTPSFFSKDDHPSWYVAKSGQKVNNLVSANSNLNSTMVLPWKQYISSLGNMFAKDGHVFIFGGNGSIFNDPEALSIGMWKLNFNLSNNGNNYAGIPYAYLLKNLNYQPELNSNFNIWNWEKSYAPIGQTNNFTYVPRLAVGGIQTNVSGGTNSFLYLAGAITIGQVTNSLTRQEVDTNGSPITNSDSEFNATTIQQKRSLQLSGANTITNTKDNTANSIDPALLFGTAFNIQALTNIVFGNKDSYENTLENNNYFDVGATMGSASSYSSYYFFNKGETSLGWNVNSTGNYSNSKKSFDPSVSAHRKYVKSPDLPTDLTYIGEVKKITSHNASNNNATLNPSSQNATASYSYSLNLLIENAKNYYYPTLSFGYSLKNIGSLTKIEMPSQYKSNSTVYGYAMQVGSSILYLNEPAFDTNSIVLHGASSTQIGDSSVVGTAKYANHDYPQTQKKTNSVNFLPFNYTGYEGVNDVISKIGVVPFIRGIACFNDTVPMITEGFKISQDPYAENSSNNNSNTKEPNLNWNNFAGLTSSNNGRSILSLWSSQNNNNFILSNSPQIPEYDLSKSSNWANYVGKQYSSQVTEIKEEDFVLLQGTRKAWFSQNINSNSSTDISIVKFHNLVNVKNPSNPEDFFVKPASQDIKTIDVTINARNNYKNLLFFGQINNGQTKSTEIGLSFQYAGTDTYESIATINRQDILGSGTFRTILSNDILSTNVNDLFDTVNLSTITNNTNDSSTYVKVVKDKWFNNLFIVDKKPLADPVAPYGPMIIIASNVNVISQSATFTTYSWNAFTKSYDITPNSQSNEIEGIKGINSLVFRGFNIMPSWVLPVLIVLPILVIITIISLTFGYCVPLYRDIKALKNISKTNRNELHYLNDKEVEYFQKAIHARKWSTKILKLLGIHTDPSDMFTRAPKLLAGGTRKSENSKTNKNPKLITGDSKQVNKPKIKFKPKLITGDSKQVNKPKIKFKPKLITGDSKNPSRFDKNKVKSPKLIVGNSKQTEFDKNKIKPPRIEDNSKS
ncbi:hypothetical protein [Mycoplasmoides pirum]|uniref:hypothetical protein n=1 Tax=Mycoplasmoides pirum TaxID=2122 RepID=UPI00048104D7|nr:hypothetical protein [Mycoplasmoides pirum]